jgi:hypothetical protein
MPSIVIPAKAGIQLPVQATEKLDSGFRRNDGEPWQGGFSAITQRCRAARVADRIPESPP